MQDLSPPCLLHIDSFVHAVCLTSRCDALCRVRFRWGRVHRAAGEPLIALLRQILGPWGLSSPVCSAVPRCNGPAYTSPIGGSAQCPRSFRAPFAGGHFSATFLGSEANNERRNSGTAAIHARLLTASYLTGQSARRPHGDPPCPRTEAQQQERYRCRRRFAAVSQDLSRAASTWSIADRPSTRAGTGRPLTARYSRVGTGCGPCETALEFGCGGRLACRAT